MEPTPLSEILPASSQAGTDRALPEAKQTTETPPAQAEAKPDTPESKDEKSGEKATPPVAEQDEPKVVPRKAHEDERRKRQQLEAELAEIKAQMAAKQQPETPPDDPLSEDKFYADPIGTIRKLNELNEQAALRNRVELSEAFARKQYADYDEAITAFAEAARFDPQLQAIAKTSPAPALFAYEQGKRIAEARKLQATDPAELRASIEAEVRAKIEAEYAAKAKAEADKQAAVAAASRPSLTQARDQGGRFAPPPFAGPTPLEHILPPR